MDPPPFVPENEDNHDVLHVLSETFQVSECRPRFPFNCADNLTKYILDEDKKLLEASALLVEKCYEANEIATDEIHEIEVEIMQKQAIQMLEYTELKNHPCLNEALKLKKTKIFKELTKDYKKYALIHADDLLPHKIAQILDFRMNTTLHTCKKCPHDEDGTVMGTFGGKYKIQPNNCEDHEVCKIKRHSLYARFVSEPNIIEFSNYEIGKTFKVSIDKENAGSDDFSPQKKFKIRNRTNITQTFSYQNFPKNSPFDLRIVTNSNRLAPGLAAEFLITYTPTDYLNEEQLILFKFQYSENLAIPLKTKRNAPKLLCYLYNPKWNDILTSSPSMRNFSFGRCAALNFTIDCGTCLLGAYTVLVMAMENDGPRGKFFVTTENEWFFNEIQGGKTRFLELHQNAFSIFPTYFEIDHGEIVELVILFMPNSEGLFSDKFFMICDNNSHQEIEILGDCITFNPSDLSVNIFLGEGLVVEHSRRVKFHLEPSESVSFIMSVSNNSPLYLDSHWTISNTEVLGNVKFLDDNMIKLNQESKCLPSNSITDLRVQITALPEFLGIYQATLNLFIENIPIFSVPPDLQFRIIGDESHNRDCSCVSNFLLLPEDDSRMFNPYEQRLWRLNEKVANVHICELKVTCKIEKKTVHEEKPHKTSPKTDDVIKEPRIKFNSSYLKFGLLPKGVEVSKSLEIENLTDLKLKWTISEVKIGPTPNEMIDVTLDQNLDKTRGKFTSKSQKRTLNYKIRTEVCKKWISLLVLSTCPRDEDLKLSNSDEIESTVESVCVVLYEVRKIDVKLYNDDNDLPLLCPKDLIYINTPIYASINVKNNGLLIGCFCFLKMTGSGCDKVKLRLSPHSGALKPGESFKINIEIVALEPGLYDELYVPCFTGNLDELTSLKILLIVNDIEVYFYLPDLDRRRYNKILWPPRSEFGPNWTQLPHDCGENKGEDNLFPLILRIPDYEQDLKKLTSYNSIALTYPTVEMRQMQIKSPSILKFYVENSSPICAKFTVDATNFGCGESSHKNALLKAKIMTKTQFWEESCLKGYGVVVQPHELIGDLVGYEVLELTLTVYANTWGLYLEEVMVEIGNLTPFCFNLLIDVSGMPIEFPFALNTICESPTLHFGNLPYLCGDVRKSVKILNITAVPLHVTWEVLNVNYDLPKPVMSLNDAEPILTKERTPELFDFGSIFDLRIVEEISNFAQVSPNRFWIAKQNVFMLDVILNIDKIPLKYSKTYLKFDLIGKFNLKSDYKFKENYFKRNTKSRLEDVKLVVDCTIELPVLKLDLIDDETKIIHHVNDFLLDKMKNPETYLIFRNNNEASVLCTIDVDKPFCIKHITTDCGNFNPGDLIKVKKGRFVEVLIKVKLSFEDFMDFSEFIYPEIRENQDEDDGNVSSSGSNLVEGNFILTISKNLYVKQKGAPQQMIPLDLILHYPRIEVKPDFIKFGRVLIFNTKKKYLTITNPTGGSVMFEIYKNCADDNFMVNPSFGTIMKTTGVNKQFIDIAVYFTPRESLNYQETLRIYTNFPRYFLDVLLTGYGSNNEKFASSK